MRFRSSGNFSLCFRLFAIIAAILQLAISFPCDARAEASVDVARKAGLIIVEASISAPIDAQFAWQVLTDYEHLADFIPGIRKSRVVSTAGEPIQVEQLGESGALFYHLPIEIVLQMDETPFESIRFHAVGGNIEQMEGVWRLEGSAPVHVHYSARVKPEFWVPPLIGPAVIRHDVQLQLDGLAREMERRAAHSRSSHSSP